MLPPAHQAVAAWHWWLDMNGVLWRLLFQFAVCLGHWWRFLFPLFFFFGVYWLCRLVGKAFVRPPGFPFLLALFFPSRVLMRLAEVGGKK